MNCPEPVARILLQLLSHAALIIRVAGWEGDARRCAREADHIHNLPGLLANYSDDKLRYYWDVERPCYLRSCELLDRAVPQLYQRLWEELTQHIP
jgi:hypothetical protein